MDDWFHQLATESTLRQRKPGRWMKKFFIIEGPVPASKLEQLRQACDHAMREATASGGREKWQKH